MATTEEKLTEALKRLEALEGSKPLPELTEAERLAARYPTMQAPAPAPPAAGAPPPPVPALDPEAEALKRRYPTMFSSDGNPRDPSTSH